MTLTDNLKSFASIPMRQMPRMAPKVPSPVLYTGPTQPTAYEPDWGKYTNLNSDPKYKSAVKGEQSPTLLAFQSFPQDLLFYAHTKAFSTLIPNRMTAPTASASDVESAHAAYLAKFAATRTTLNSVVSAITASPPTVTKREHVDKAFEAKKV